MSELNRIGLHMTINEAIMEMCEGNPGAVNVMIQLAEHNSTIDPDSALGPVSALSHLDQLGIYGQYIWMAYKDVCGESIPKLIAVLRAVQLGILEAKDLKEAVTSSRSGRNIVSVDADAIYDKVKETLPKFDNKY